jgi:leucyl aminopeptidase
MYLKMKSLFVIIPGIMALNLPLSDENVTEDNNNEENQDVSDVPLESNRILRLPQGPPPGPQAWISFDQDAIPLLSPFLKTSAEKTITEGTAAEAVSHAAYGQVNLPDIQKDNGYVQIRMHGQNHRCGGYMVHETQEEAKQAINLPINRFSFEEPAINQDDIVRRLEPEITEKGIRSTIQSLSEFQNRYYLSQTGADASRWISKEWKNLLRGISYARS